MDNKDKILVNSNLIRRHSSMKVDLSAPVQVFMWQVLQDSLETLDVSRISVWLLKSEPNNILECVANTDWGVNDTPNELPHLTKSDYPRYFEAIEFGTPIVANNALTDHRTIDFTETYLKIENIKSMLDTIIFSEGSPIGVVCFEQKVNFREWNSYEVYFAELIADCCTYRFMAQKQAKLEERLVNLVFHDELTGVYNRRYFFDTIEKTISLHERKNLPITIGFIDFDNFKSINDTYGHQAGDKVLKSFTKIAQTTLRREDLIFRFGGEEFLVVFQGVGLMGANNALVRLQSAVKNILINHGIKALNFTFSAGLVELDKRTSIKDVIKQADKQLYKAKEEGKNRVEY
ncbi:sensor domain-containing diguanylate cyclase [Pseudoalteromonas shioyasakiensis]|nr:sensor domain-containing diguanylate cyclase [Pseudoalteromonas shioyasakiensis]